MASSVDIATIWAFIIAFAVFVYVVMDGFDLGIGILFPVFGVGRERDTAMNSIAPVWDGNETWLVLGGGGLMAAFPLAYSIVMSALYAPLIAMLLASPHTQRRYFIALYVPILFLLARQRTGPDPPERRLITVALAATAAAGTILPLLLPGRRFALAYEAYSPHFFGTLAMWAALIVIAVRIKAAECPPRGGP